MGTLIFNLNMMKMMKYRLLFLYILGMTVAACNNDLPDELFVKRVVIAERRFPGFAAGIPGRWNGKHSNYDFNQRNVPYCRKMWRRR